jgi:cell wall-associated NlpC family hydrolase
VPRILSAYLLALVLLGILAVPAGAQTVAAPTPLMGGSAFGEANPADALRIAGEDAKLLSNGKAAAPADAPEAVQQAIAAANQIIGRPYVYGGGHKSFLSRGYDCSGTVSFALHGGDLLSGPLDSSSFLSWGKAGRGDWITIYTNPGHAFVVIAGLRLDTSAAGDPSGAKGPRWRPTLRSTAGFRARHPVGL